MLNRIMQHIIHNNKDNIFYKYFYDVFIELLYFDYNKMRFTGSENDVLDFSKTSMFWWNDPIEIIIKLTKNNVKLLNYAETMLLDLTKNLIEEEKIEKQLLMFSTFSGLSYARDSDWGTLENYGKEMKEKIAYKGLVTDENKNKLINELFNSDKINTAIHHTWSNRYYFINSDGSHRLAALYNQDITQNNNTRIELRLLNRKLQIDCGKSIFNNYNGIITTGKTYLFLCEHLKKSNTRILLEKYQPSDNDLCILWTEKSQDKLASCIVKFVSYLPSDRCYIINNTLEKYL